MRRLAIRAVCAAAILCTGAAPAAASGPQEDRVTMSLDGEQLSKVLETFALQYRLNIVYGPDVAGTVTMNLFDVPVEEALEVVLAVNGYGFRKNDDMYLVRRLDELQSPAADPVDVAVVWLDYLTAEEALRLIEPLRSENGLFSAGTKAERGIQSDPTSAGGNQPAGGEVLVLRDRSSVIEQARRVLADLDRRPRQVLIEATILEVKLDDSTKLGIDFNAFFGVDFSDLDAVVNPDNTISFQPAGGDLISDGFQTVGTAGFADNTNTDGLHINIVNDDFALFLEALEALTETTVLANPRVLAIHGQKAEIIIGAKLGYLTTTTTETATVQEVDFLDTGTQLRFRPYIAGDGFIRMEIHPESSNGVVDATTGLPSETTTEVTTNVMIENGDTIVIGGLIDEKIETVVKQVPFFGTIPVIGWLFRQTIESVERREVIVLLTPHIVEGTDDAAGIEQADAMASARDHLFHRQLPFSRARMAAPYKEKALLALAEGRAMDALTLAETALDLFPSDVEAAKVRLRALAALGLPDLDSRTLEELEGLR
jgi:type IV pilus secretin PilQ/predicted competence protein